MITRNFSRFAPAFFACAALAGVSGYAAAADPMENATQVTIDYSDLNLSSTTGAKSLYGRIVRASGFVCGQRPDSRAVARSSIWNTCRNDAISSAVATVNHPSLTALHQGKSGTRELPVLASASSTTAKAVSISNNNKK